MRRSLSVVVAVLSLAALAPEPAEAQLRLTLRWPISVERVQSYPMYGNTFGYQAPLYQPQCFGGSCGMPAPVQAFRPVSPPVFYSPPSYAPPRYSPPVYTPPVYYSPPMYSCPGGVCPSACPGGVCPAPSPPATPVPPAEPITRLRILTPKPESVDRLWTNANSRTYAGPFNRIASRSVGLLWV